MGGICPLFCPSLAIGFSMIALFPGPDLRTGHGQLDHAHNKAKHGFWLRRRRSSNKGEEKEKLLLQPHGKDGKLSRFDKIRNRFSVLSTG